MSTETVNWEAVARYLAGECSADELAAIQRWLADHPSDAKTIAALDDALRGLPAGAQAQEGIDVEAALAAVNSRRAATMRILRGGAPAAATRVAGSNRSRSWMLVAAAAAVVVAAGGLFWRSSAPEAGTPVGTIAARVVTSPVGGRDSLRLPDGTQVILGPGSELKIAEGFGDADRRVSVRGEALFTVAHDDARSFIVDANGAEIRDIGTAFVVHSDASGARVAVTEGIVEVRGASQQVVTTLNAGDAASVTPSGKVTAERGVGATSDLAWTRGELVFRDTPLSQVAEDLQRWYGVHLEIEDQALRRRPLSASFTGDSLKRVLDAISLAMGATMEQRRDTIVVRSRPR